ncbi:MAG: hypothetical protein QW400_04605 [Candidatus Diapherotrites archaeon]
MANIAKRPINKKPMQMQELPPQLRRLKSPPELIREVLKYRDQPISSSLISERIGGRLTPQQVNRILWLAGRPKEITEALKRGQGGKGRGETVLYAGYSGDPRARAYMRAISKYSKMPLNMLEIEKRRLNDRRRRIMTQIESEKKKHGKIITGGLRQKLSACDIELAAIETKIKGLKDLKKWASNAPHDEVLQEYKYRSELWNDLNRRRKELGKKVSSAMKAEMSRLQIELGLLASVIKQRGI